MAEGFLNFKGERIPVLVEVTIYQNPQATMKLEVRSTPEADIFSSALEILQLRSFEVTVEESPVNTICCGEEMELNHGVQCDYYVCTHCGAEGDAD